MNEQYRHGDLLIEKINTIPEQAKKIKHRVLAEGEATGHLHEIIEEDVSLYEKDNELYFEVPDMTERELRNLVDSSITGATLIHPEHGTIPIPPGIYHVQHQQEYTPQEIRRVVD